MAEKWGKEGYEEVAQGRDMFGCYVSGSGSRDHKVVRDWSNVTIRVGPRTKGARARKGSARSWGHCGSGPGT